MSNIDRRELAKGLAAGLVAAGIGQKSLSAQTISASDEHQLKWQIVLPGIWKATLGTPEAHTPASMRVVDPLTKAIGALPAVSALPLTNVRGRLTTRGCRLALPLQAGEMMYGFGLQLLSFQQRGKKRIIRVNADPKGDSGDSHAPVPFYVSDRGYGVLVDTLRHAEFYCGESHPKPTKSTSIRQAAVNTPQDTHERNLASESHVLVEVPRASGLDLYLFAGPSMLQAVQRYNLFSGGGVLPPEWGLGFWYRAEMHGDHAEILTLAREFRESRIPCDVIGLEPGWQTHAYSCSFAWDRNRFPDPKQFISELAKQDYKVNLWEHAFTHPSSPIFNSLGPYAGDFAVWEGLVPDFADEHARKVFGDYHGKELIDLGISGFKLDECDNSDFTNGWSFPDMSHFPSGLDGEQMHAVFGLKYQLAIWQQFQQRQQPTYNLVRSSGAFAAPYPFVLYSDLYSHREFVRGVVNCGFSGLLWCPEVRDAASEEDLIRRLQSVVFSPLAMVNAWYIKNPPWKQLNRELNNTGHLSENWQSLEARCREIIEWRMQFIPYLLAAFQHYASDGTPPFRALVLDCPEDKNMREIDDAYMMGDRILVAPLFAGEPGRKITLPSGEWHDFWTGERIRNQGALEVPATTEKIPVFVKSGSVIPLATPGASTNDAISKELTVRVYGDGHLAWKVHSGTANEVELSWDSVQQRGSVRQMNNAKGYRVIQWQHMG
jgi:alpha-D-xyloside xylohydrolase